MSIYFYNVGQTVKVPLLDPGNEEYLSRVDTLGGLVAGIVEKWEIIQVQGRKEKASSLAYTIRKLAEMLSSEDMMLIPKQPFFRKISVIMEKLDHEGPDPTSTEKAMKILSSGLSKIHNRLDFGLSPFETESSRELELSLVEEKDRRASRMLPEFDFKRKTPAVVTN